LTNQPITNETLKKTKPMLHGHGNVEMRTTRGHVANS